MKKIHITKKEKKAFNEFLNQENQKNKHLSFFKKIIHVIKTLNHALNQNRYYSYILICSFPICLAILVYLSPNQPSVPSINNLQHIEGEFDYVAAKPKVKYGTYLINGEKFNCAQVLRLFPFENCPITREAKAFKNQPVSAKWYKQRIGFSQKNILVEMTFDNDIYYMGILDTKKLLDKLHKANQTFYNMFAPIFILIYFLIVFLSLYFIYRIQRYSDFEAFELEKTIESLKT